MAIKPSWFTWAKQYGAVNPIARDRWYAWGYARGISKDKSYIAQMQSSDREAYSQGYEDGKSDAE
jgi:hypothetical protein